jgi:hypothetical protein
LADLDRATLVEALNASKLSKSGDIQQIVQAMGKEFRQAQTQSADRSNTVVDNLSQGTTRFLDNATDATVKFASIVGGVTTKALDFNLRLSDLSAVGTDVAKTLASQGLGMENLGKIIGVTGDALTGMIKYVEKNVDTWRDLSGVGASFANDAIAMDVAMKNARLSNEEFRDIIKTNSVEFARMGGTVTQGVKAFTDMSKQFHESGFGEELRQLGYNEKEINQLLIDQMATRRLDSRLDSQSMKESIESAKALALEQDQMSKLTGKSRQELEKNTKALQEDSIVKSNTELAIRKGNAGAAEAMDRISLASQQLGPEMQKMVMQVAATGIPLQGQLEMFAMIGTEAQNLFIKAGEAVDRGDKAEAARLTQEGVLAAARSKSMEQALEIGAAGNRRMADIAVQTIDAARRQRKASEEMAAKGEDPTDTKKLNELMRAELKKEQDAKSGVTATVVAMEDQMGKFTAAMGNNVIGPLNNQIGPGLLDFYNNTLKPLAKKTDRDGTFTPSADEARAQQARRDKEEADKKKREELGLGPPTQLERLRNAPRDDLKNSLTQLFKDGLNIPYAILNVAGNAILGGQTIPIPKQAGGSKETFGDWFGKDWGDGGLSMLHGKEAVVPQAKLGEFMSDMQKNQPPMPSQAKLAEFMSDMQKNAPSAMKIPMNENFTTQISSSLKAATSSISSRENMESGPKSVPATKVPAQQPVREDASLNDVVASLNQLNTRMAQLLDAQMDLGTRQIRATKSNNANLFART